MNIVRYAIAVTFSFSVLSVFVNAAGLRSHCKDCGKSCDECHVEARTVKVPMLVTEQRVRNRIVEKEVEREVKCTVFKQVPKDRTIKLDCWYLDDEVKQKEVTDKSCQLVSLPVLAKRKTLVPMKEEYCVECCNQTCRCSKTQLVEVTKEEQKTQTSVVFPETIRTVDYCVKAPKKHTIELSKDTVTTLEPVQQTKKVKVCVPEVVRDVVEVQVWKEMTRTEYYCDHCYKKLNAGKK